MSDTTITNLPSTASESDLVATSYIAMDVGSAETKKLPGNCIAPKKYGTNEIANLPDTITTFRAGDNIVVDGPSGTAKMSKDDLLKEAAENSLSNIHSLSDTATEAELTADNYFVLDDNGNPQKLGSSILAKNSTISMPIFSGIRSTYGTPAQDTNITLYAGKTYVLYLKSASQSDGDAPFVFYQNGTGFCKVSSQELYDGITAVFTPSATANLFIRTYNSSTLACELVIKQVVHAEEILNKQLTLVKEVFNFTTGTAAVGTGVTLTAGKLYKLSIKTATLADYSGISPILYQNGIGAITEASAQELADGVYVFFTPTASAELMVRTWNSSYIAFSAKVEEVTRLDDVKQDSDGKIPSSTIEKSVADETFTAAGTTFYSTNIRLCKGKTYRIFCKTSTLINADYALNYLYSRDLAEEGGVSNIASAVAGALFNGTAIEYTPSDNIVLQYRTWEASVEMRVVVTELVGNATLHDTKLIRKQLDKVATAPTETTPIQTTIVAPANYVTKIKVRSTTLVTSVQTIRVLYSRSSPNDNAKIIAKCTPQQLLDGYEISVCPSADWSIFVRPEQGSKTVYIEAETDCEKESVSGGSNSIVAVYGDSITAISNGNDKYVGWAKHFAEECNLKSFYGRGIGGSKYSYSWGGGAVTFVSTDDGTYNSRNDSYNKDNYTGAVPAGCVAIRSALCSWDRITNMFPASIKDGIDYVILFGGANDADSEIVDEAEFVVGSSDDPEWYASDEYATYGGDFNISCMRGALASCIMKFQAWMPNAKIIVATPISGQGTTGQISTDIFIKMYDKSVQIKEIASRCSCPCIDVYGTDGISPFNRTRYITDSIHPYNDYGRRAVGVALAQGFMRIKGTYNF